MPQVEQSIDIRAPLPRVFDFVANQPERMADWWPPIDFQQRVTPAPTVVGSISRYVYNMMGVRIKGEHEVLALTPDAHLLVKTISGIDSAFEFIFSPSGSGTRLTIRVDYRLPGALIAQLINRLAIEERNLQDLREGLQNLKTLLEAEAVSR